MTLIVRNTCYGGYGVSVEAQRMLLERGCKHIHLEKYNRGLTEMGLAEFCQDLGILQVGPDTWANDTHRYENRDCEVLVQVVRELGARANGSHADLEVVEIPDDVEWIISEYDGAETIEEKHRSW